MGDFDTTMELAGEAMMEHLATETVTYTPLGGAALTRTAIVHRRYPMQLADSVVYTAAIQLRNDAALGRLASAINTGGDTITYSPKRGGPTKTAPVLQILHQDAGCVIVEVE